MIGIEIVRNGGRVYKQQFFETQGFDVSSKISSIRFTANSESNSIKFISALSASTFKFNFALEDFVDGNAQDSNDKYSDSTAAS